MGIKLIHLDKKMINFKEEINLPIMDNQLFYKKKHKITLFFI